MRGLGNPASKPRCSNGRRTKAVAAKKSNKGGKKENASTFHQIIVLTQQLAPAARPSWR